MSLARRTAVSAALLAVLCTACAPASATGHRLPASTPTQATAPTTDEVVAVFEAWNTSLAADDPERMADHYTDDAILLPTVDGDVLDTRAERVEYFDAFLDLQPRGTIVEPYVRVLGPDAAVLSGLYDFAVMSDGEPGTVQARMTYLFERTADGWRIAEHHSSKRP